MSSLVLIGFLFVGFLMFLLLSGLFVGGLWEAFGDKADDPEQGDRNRRILVVASFLIVFAVFAWFMGGFAGYW